MLCFLSPRSGAALRSFFFNDTATTEIYTLSLHDALPISSPFCKSASRATGIRLIICCRSALPPDRKSTRLNSSHVSISYAVFCLKKKKEQQAVLTPERQLHALQAGRRPNDRHALTIRIGA